MRTAVLIIGVVLLWVSITAWRQTSRHTYLLSALLWGAAVYIALCN